MATDEEREQALADRFSAALTEIGDASIALILGEREGCARVLDAQAEASGSPLISAALAQAATAIRNRPK